MADERRRRAEAIFQDALDRPPEQRAAFVAEACTGDRELLLDVQSLLDIASEESTFLESGPVVVHAALAAGAPPERFGQYRIIRLIGQGGMGAVYEAEQANPRRTVALKAIRPGIAGHEMLRRFEHEAWVLGQLQHPGIAQIFEAGAIDTAAGRQPFFAMELVRGRSLTEYADAERLGTRQRLELLAKVCDAVQHAHQKGVVHRDLKPGNILVDATGQPKVLDFGVARVTDADVQTVTMRTDVGQLVGTVPYMSPEQIAGDSRQLDVRSDVYALGVVLYELLTGRLPHDVRHRSLADAVRIIRDDEPTRLSSIKPVFRGDIETIVGRAMEKDKQRRYQSASELAADIRRYLRDEPIVARPATTWYQFRKFARRNRAVVGGAAVALLLLVAGTITSTILYLRADAAGRRESEQRKLAERRRDEAEQASAESKAVLTFLLSDMIGATAPEREGYAVRVVDVLDAAVPRISQRFADQPRVAVMLHGKLAEMYSNLGLADKALRRREEAQQLCRAVFGEEDRRTIESDLEVVESLVEARRWADALPLAIETAERAERVLGPDDRAALQAATALGDVMQVLGDHEKAEPLLRQTLDASRRLFPDDKLVYRALNALNACLRAQGRDDEALRREEFEGTRRLYGESNPLTIIALNNYAACLQGVGKFAEAEAMVRQALQTIEPRLPPNHPIVGELYNNLSTSIARQARPAEAAEVVGVAIRMLSASLGERDAATQRARRQLVRFLSAAGQLDQAEEAVLNAISARAVAGDPPDRPDLLQMSAELAWRLAETVGDCEKAEQWLARAQPTGRAPLSDSDATARLCELARAWCLARSDQVEEARRLLVEVLESSHRAPSDQRLITRWVRESLERLEQRLSGATSAPTSASSVGGAL